jgi:hypothetical protein
VPVTYQSQQCASPGARGRIEISLRKIDQLFNSMDPSPFLEKDLDHDAEQFLVEWAQEHPHDKPLELVLHLQECPQEPRTQRTIRDAVRNYFCYRARQSRTALRQLLHQGQISLMIGLGFLSGCLLLSDFLASHVAGSMAVILQESLSIGGWVAMWRPLQIYLYDWWPIRGRTRIYARMSRMQVRLQPARVASVSG